VRERSRPQPTEAQVRGLVRRYLAVRAALKAATVLRSDRTVQSDYAEWLAARRLRLRLVPTSIQAGYDATDSRQRKYQIKARVVHSLSRNTSFDFHSLEHPFDFLIGVFFDNDLRLLGIIKVPRSVVEEKSRSNRGSARLRWSRTLAADPRIERLYWSSD
jgi:hypothetical protein